MEEKKLYKSRNNRMICGVCGGLGEFFHLDPTLFRLIWAVWGCVGVGIIIYLVAAVVMPEAPEDIY
jgi:phage shock protein C